MPEPGPDRPREHHGEHLRESAREDTEPRPAGHVPQQDRGQDRGQDPGPGQDPGRHPGPGGRPPQQYQQWSVQQWQAPPSEPPAWVLAVRSADPGPVRTAVLWSALATGLLSALLLGDGLGVGLLVAALPAAVAAGFAAVAARRRPRPWTLLWAAVGLALLVVPALRDAGWPTFLAVTAALGAGSLALHGGRTWAGVLLGPVGLLASVVPGGRWAWAGLRERGRSSKDRWWPAVRAVLVAAGLLGVFGALFAGADAAFADLLGSLAPDTGAGDVPLRLFLLALGALGALAAARAAAAPLRFDRAAAKPGKPRGRLEWALPLVLLDVLFAAFNAVQLAVLFGGYDKVLASTGLTYAQYARQGFWQLLWATVLTLVVIALAVRWAPRGGRGDRLLVRGTLGLLCLLALVVVASALRRMDLYVEAYGLTRLRVSVMGAELWLGLVLVLVTAAGVWGARWLPRAVVAGAAAGVLAFGLASPDDLVARQNIARHAGEPGRLDLAYLQNLSADAVPALDSLPEPQRSCALEEIARELPDARTPWYAISLAEHTALGILRERPLEGGDPCERAGLDGYDRESY
ncbi:DUF4173 domain-containing protein [Streptomyces sp. NPDC059637]|uniref:DUF4153 domain-containing protein n=1 Tax=Streptomyces TaxID=1883 RepID=UPI0031CE99C5